MILLQLRDLALTFLTFIAHIALATFFVWMLLASLGLFARQPRIPDEGVVSLASEDGEHGL